jgi:hypothetical protein
MKTFASVLLIAVIANAKTLPSEDIETVVAEEDQEYWLEIQNYNAYGKNLWTGVF